MQKVLIIGSSPLPDEDVSSRPAAGLRTYQFIKGLKALDINFELKIIKIAMPECYSAAPEDAISKDDPKLEAKIKQIIAKFKPTIIIGVNNYPAFIASKIVNNEYFWADLNGWIMAEAQAQAFQENSNNLISHYNNVENSILKKADKISTVSKNQKYAILGRLASLGRLNKETFDWNFVEVIRNATEILESEKKSELSAKTRNLLPKSGKKVFWLGGYNNWADTETLFEGLEKAMTKNKDFYFVSTGGEIKGLAKNNYQKFRSLINNSKFKDRFIFLGWISTAEIPALFKEVNLGICADLLCTETLTGARNRLNEMMKFGLPVLTSKGSEIAEIIKTCDAGEVFESGSANDLAEKLLKMLSDPKKYGENGQKYVKNYDFKTSVKAVSKYIKTPQKAPDYGLEINLNSKFSKIKAGWFYLKKNGLRKFIKKLLAFRY